MMQIQTRKSTNLTLDAALLSDAKALHVNLSRAAENGVRLAVAQASRPVGDEPDSFLNQRKW